MNETRSEQDCGVGDLVIERPCPACGDDSNVVFHAHSPLPGHISAPLVGFCAGCSGEFEMRGGHIWPTRRRSTPFAEDLAARDFVDVSQT